MYPILLQEKTAICFHFLCELEFCPKKEKNFPKYEKRSRGLSLAEEKPLDTLRTPHTGPDVEGLVRETRREVRVRQDYAEVLSGAGGRQWPWLDRN